MSLGSNICFLRKQKKFTQEQFAEKMEVTRQTVSRWESDEVVPELAKLIEMSDIFACKLDALVKEKLSDQGDVYSENAEAYYAVITIKEPCIQPFERIPNAYKLIMEYLQANNFKEKQQDDIVSCFEYEYEENGITYMDVYIHVDGVTKVNAFSQLS